MGNGALDVIDVTKCMKAGSNELCHGLGVDEAAIEKRKELFLSCIYANQLLR